MNNKNVCKLSILWNWRTFRTGLYKKFHKMMTRSMVGAFFFDWCANETLKNQDIRECSLKEQYRKSNRKRVFKSASVNQGSRMINHTSMMLFSSYCMIIINVTRSLILLLGFIYVRHKSLEWQKSIMNLKKYRVRCVVAHL